jgi:hypothetical protein
MTCLLSACGVLFFYKSFNQRVYMIKLFLRFPLFLLVLSNCVPIAAAGFFDAYPAFGRGDLKVATDFCSTLNDDQRTNFLLTIVGDFGNAFSYEQIEWFVEQEKTLTPKSLERLNTWVLPKAAAMLQKTLDNQNFEKATDLLATFTYSHKAELLSQVYSAVSTQKASLAWYLTAKSALKPALRSELTTYEKFALGVRAEYAKTVYSLGSKPRIALVTMRLESDLKFCNDLNKTEYAAANGYDMYVFPASPEGKAELIAQVIEGYDWVCWVDSDALIMDMSRKLESFIDPHYDVVVSEQEASLPYQVLSTGVFLVKNSTNGRRILDEMRTAKHLELLPLLNHFSEEQAALNALVLADNAVAQTVKILPQRSLDAYANGSQKGSYQPGDFVLHFAGATVHEKTKAVQEAYTWLENNGEVNDLITLCRSYPSVADGYLETQKLWAQLLKKADIIAAALKDGRKVQAIDMYNTVGNPYYRAVVLEQLVDKVASFNFEAQEWVLRKFVELPRAHQVKVANKELGVLRSRVEQAKHAKPTQKTRIAIVSLHTQELVNGQLPGGFYADVNKQQYAAKHGYDLYLYHASPVRTAGEMGLSRAECFDKARALLEVVEGYDWVFWVSPNTLIINQDTKLESLIDKKYEFIATKEASPLPYPVVSTGSFFVKNAPGGKRVLQELVANKHQDKDDRYAFCPDDQKALNTLLSADSSLKPYIKLLSQRALNAMPNFFVEGTYQPGDFALNFDGGNGELAAKAMKAAYTWIQEKKLVEIVALCKSWPDGKGAHQEALAKLPKK